MPDRVTEPRVRRAAAVPSGMAPLVSVVPIPDPTELTTDQLRRELNGLRELLETRLDAIDERHALLRAHIEAIPVDIDRRILHLRELHDERFNFIQKQFIERDLRAQTRADAMQRNISDAMVAQKEASAAQFQSITAAITKSDASSVKQIDGLLTLVNSISTATNEKIGVINGRLDRGDGLIRGGEGVRTEARLNVGAVASMVSAGVVLTTAFAGLVAFALRH